MNALVGKLTAVATVPAPVVITTRTNDGLKDGVFYWIERKLSSGTKVKEIALFCKSPTNRSLYEGKWQIFDRITKVYHTKEIKILSKIETPTVIAKEFRKKP